MAGMMMKLAEEAWGEVIKEKMKTIIEKQGGDRMDKVAAAGVEAAGAFHMGKMKTEADMQVHKKKIEEAFMGLMK